VSKVCHVLSICLSQKCARVASVVFTQLSVLWIVPTLCTVLSSFSQIQLDRSRVKCRRADLWICKCELWQAAIVAVEAYKYCHLSSFILFTQKYDPVYLESHISVTVHVCCAKSYCFRSKQKSAMHIQFYASILHRIILSPLLLLISLEVCCPVSDMFACLTHISVY